MKKPKTEPSHEWSLVNPKTPEFSATYRMRVPGGWLYRYGGVGIVFVPWEFSAGFQPYRNVERQDKPKEEA